ncbi:CmlA/FloR family chloramphenicol efflux MFS transporter [Brucella pecoris]|uniref:Bcr/CflA family efflux transporter n=1 Tax=Brucella pecoris TaxID=867683 RepID=A0A5C5CHW9_9HYPH|nr:CmlA/FloR family chloramphenicol efflux MFS transporter [Brucella pecoris]MBB4095026.1 DHA1 family florfenicol/chloramphenicol resistance protein-like MFS transporter [Brucella pecoris]TNV10920.1 CmlA/FloR family chloramphenicol efflux MFS transporter [Brucella pecoris]
MPFDNKQNSRWGHSLPFALALMAPFDILASLAMDIYLPVVPSMPAILQTTSAMVQLTLSLYMVMLGVGQLLFGPLSDRFGRRPILVGGGLVFALSSFALAITDNATLFVALRFVQATGASAALVATFATVRDIYATRPEGATIYGLFSAMLSFVPALGPIAGALIAKGFGWRAIFATLGVFGLVATWRALRHWHETRPASNASSTGSLGRIMMDFSFWTYTLGFATAMGTFFVFFSTAPRILIERGGFGETSFSFAFASVAIVMIAATRILPRHTQRWGARTSVALGMAVLLASALLLFAGEKLLQPSFTSLIVPMWLAAVGIVLTASMTANGALAAFDDSAGMAVAVYFCIQSLIVSLAGTALVIFLPGDTAWPLIVFCTFMPLLVLVLLAKIRKD